MQSEPKSKADRPVVLVGMMGAGKSRVGRALAQAMGRAFWDADDEITQACARSIAEIFQQDGEAQFREYEREVLARLLAGQASVIAAGGGAFAQSATRALIAEQAFSVWLDVPRDVLLARLAGATKPRPLLPDDPAELASALDRLLAERRADYEKADLRVSADADTPEKTAQTILIARKEQIQ